MWRPLSGRLSRLAQSSYFPLNDLIRSVQSPKTLVSNFSVQGRWIVRDGRRLKLACVNWPAHMEALLPEV
jgi:hypothetical protein